MDKTFSGGRPPPPTCRARDRGHKLQRHVDLAYQFALVAPLGGGAMVALQALHLPESDEGSLRTRHARCPEWMGSLAVALAQGLPFTGSAVGNEAAQSGTSQKHGLRPMIGRHASSNSARCMKSGI